MALTNGDNLVTVEGLRSVYDLINNDIKNKSHISGLAIMVANYYLDFQLL